MPTLNYRVTWSKTELPEIGKWNYNGAYEALNFLFDEKLNKKLENIIKKSLLYSSKSIRKKYGTNVYVYVPDAWKENDVNSQHHIVFHGCFQTIENIKLQYIEERKKGYNEVS